MPKFVGTIRPGTPNVAVFRMISWTSGASGHLSLYFRVCLCIFGLVTVKRDTLTGLIEDGGGRDKGDAVVATLEHAAPLSAKEISAQTGIKLNTLRPILRRLIESELIVATAPATSRYRKYVLA